MKEHSEPSKNVPDNLSEYGERMMRKYSTQMNEPSKEETKLQSEQKTAEEILDKYVHYTQRHYRFDVLKAMDEYAAQFKSQLPINQNMLNLIKEADAWLSFNTSPSAEQIMQFRKSLQEVIAAESQPLPIEGVERERKGIFQIAREIVDSESVSITSKEVLDFMDKRKQDDLWQEAFDLISEREFKGQPFMDELQTKFTITRNVSHPPTYKYEDKQK